MLKYILFISINVFLINTANCERRDTAIFYLKNDFKGYHKVSTLDSADFFRMILPADSGDDRFNIREYYKNGKIKFVGKADSRLKNHYLPGEFLLSDDCINYFPNSKKQRIAHYYGGYKDGPEYLFYPTGAIFCTIKHTLSHATFNDKVQYWECYDSKGAMICKEGNGEWIIYDNAFKNIIKHGPIRNGYMEGDWHGRSLDADSIKYTFKFNKGVFVSGIGYDKAGAAYPFLKESEWANYRGGPLTFVEVFRSHLTLPKGPDGKKMSADTVHISFTIEKDGHVSNFKTLGEVNPDLNNALAEALAKCHDWTPSRLYGIPLRTEIVLPLDFTHGYSSDSRSYHKEFFFKTRILGF
jgi:antitoxin component YwqK of YwqJK toxin-antitoxin module